MFALALFSSLAFGVVQNDVQGREARTRQFLRDLRGGNCDCNWTKGGSACGQDDGSVCWGSCCGSSGGGGGGCDCAWTKGGANCGQSDGSKCWTVCCKGGGGGGQPTPPPVNPTPTGDWVPLEITPKTKSLRAGRLNSTLTNGFAGTGGLGWNSAFKLNLLGGGIKATVDLSGVQNLVNANMYLVVPGTLQGAGYYCDNSDGMVSKNRGCMELDLYEGNGHQLVASTMHTKLGHNTGCDTWGCRQMTYFGGTINGNKAFDVIVSVANDGDITIQLSQDGKTQTAFSNPSGWDGAAKAAVVDAMKNHGAVLVMTQWTGWVPPNTSGQGNLGGSTYKVSNIMWKGSNMGGF